MCRYIIYRMYFIPILVLLTFVCVKPETFCPVGSSSFDTRSDKTKLRIVQYNVEWLFLDYYAASDCPGNGCAWTNESAAKEHLQHVSTIIQKLQPDILNLCEVEGCDELSALVTAGYTPFIIRGKDTSTGQNVGMLTRIGPSTMYRTEERVSYPIAGSTCGYTGAVGDSGVSKHYISEFLIGGRNVAMIGAHLVAFPTDAARCAQREAQAQVLQNVVLDYVNKGYDIIITGDLNDFDGEVLDANSNKPISHVLDILKGNVGLHAGAYQLTNVAEKIDQSKRMTDWWDRNKDCVSKSTEFSMIDHILVTDALREKITNSYIYNAYTEFCGTYNSDHYPVVVDFEI